MAETVWQASVARFFECLLKRLDMCLRRTESQGATEHDILYQAFENGGLSAPPASALKP